MLRRAFLVAVPLGACSTITDSGVGKIAQDVNILATGLNGVLTQLGNISILGLTPAIMSTVGSAIASIQALAVSISTATSTAAAQPLVQKIETYVNTVVSALAVLPLPPAIALALQAASILLPIIETAVGLLVTAKPMLGNAMNPDEARIILRGYALKVR